MTDTLTLDQELAELDEEEVEVRDGLVFRAPTEVLPQTARTAELKRRKVEQLKKKKEEMETLRRQKEQEEAHRRLKEQEAKKIKATTRIKEKRRRTEKTRGRRT